MRHEATIEVNSRGEGGGGGKRGLAFLIIFLLLFLHFYPPFSLFCLFPDWGGTERI